jgi:hypothetical protein
MATGGITTPIITVIPMIIPNQMGVIAQFDDDGIKDGSRQDHKSQIIDERPTQQINEGDENHGQIPGPNRVWMVQSAAIMGIFVTARKWPKMVETGNEHQDHAGRPQRFTDGLYKSFEGQISL